MKVNFAPERLGRLTVYLVLVGAPVGLGGTPWWSLACLSVVAFLGVGLWLLPMFRRGLIEWRRTPLDLPLAIFAAFVLAQIAIGNSALAAWALAQPASLAEPAALPTPFLTVGTISPPSTAAAFLLFVAYASVYVVVVQLFRRRRHLDALVRTLLVVGAAVAAVGLLDYFSGGTLLARLREAPRRVAGPFTNADHFGAWLNLLVFLGVGWLLTRAEPRSATSAASRPRLSEKLNEYVRRHVLVVAIVVMAAGVVFTLSRGAVLSFITALVAMVILAAASGLTRARVAGISLLLGGILAYAVWLGYGPMLARLQHGDVAGRWAIYKASLPILADFPVFGIGLGAYQDISSLYHPREIDPLLYTLNAVHNDWLQLVVETGVPGVAIMLFAIYLVGRDLFAHLLGRGRCMVGGGDGSWARRHDTFSVGLSLGAIAALISLMAHSGVDFAARTPANGFLAAALLGIASVALHTRFGTEDGFLARRFTWSPPTQTVRWLVAGTALVGMLIALGAALRPAIVVGLLDTRGGAIASAGRVAAAATVDGGSVRALLARADLNIETARAIAVEGQTAAVQAERRHDAAGVLRSAIDDLRHAIGRTPTSVPAHERLAAAYQDMAQVDASRTAAHLAASVTHLKRAVALAPEHPLVRRNLAYVSVAAFPQVPAEIALEAARNAVERKPELLPDLVYHFLVLPLAETQWLQLVPATLEHRLTLGHLLEERRLVKEAVTVHTAAVEIASPSEGPLARWVLARTLAREKDHAAALRELGRAMQLQPENPELHLTAAEMLEKTGEPSALDMYRSTVAKAETLVRRGGRLVGFDAYEGALSAVVARELGNERPAAMIRYRRALARYLAERELWGQALQQSDTVLQEAPRDAVALFARAAAYQGLGRLDDALETFRAAVSADTGNVGYRMRFAKLLWETRQPYQAINEWNAVLGQDPGNLEAALSIARTYQQAGAKVDTLRAYQRVLNMAPDNAEARRALTRLGWIPP